MGSVRKKTHAASVMNLYLETDTWLRDEQDDRPLPHQIRNSRQTGKTPSKVQAIKDRAHEKEGKDSLARSAVFDMLRRRRSPAKRQRRVVRQDQLLLLKEYLQLGCVSQGSHPSKSVLWNAGNLGSKHTVNFSRSTWHQQKKRERKGPSRGIAQKREPRERYPCAPEFVDRSREITSQQEGCARKAAWDLARNIDKLKSADKSTFYSPSQARATPARPLQNLRGTRIRG